ncbi:MAG: Ni2+ ABC transporter Ni2+-binding protein NikK [Candidatus Desulfovibrio kirbyi]|uniref:Ni2+ ABC transporter Ni2+-binding protein NikK n=1 Tax=Candidatus Desulfovibrio kirbyi TaxID=2696086 RepID=A0A6L2R3Y4_9BACT|nr:MAG: Ni2+ ABC transporter Ni2+-binding protein NikK [Candidatus Desulfovibrio kirbyi]
MAKIVCTIVALLLCWTAQAGAHFGIVIPSSSTVTEKKDAALTLGIAFAHPMEQQGMDMDSPKAFGVILDGKNENLKPLLKPVTLMGHKAWQAVYTISKPGVYQFVVEPTPYFEPAEDTWIVHYTKTVVAAFGAEDGWDAPTGAKAEIVPLTRPFANYAGNVFQGQVLVDGKPVPNAAVEVEYYNDKGKRKAQNDYFVTQTVKTDGNGVFAFGVPWAGWWGFAALSESGEKLAWKGAMKPVEIGAVLWLEFATTGR